ncbi:GerAB/ArcD/ProY family transporter [Radiobacillus kanasensis]|uniref:YkvI family membrane protein n=1 Tax=Radiobacillus kanasensis TaxID=2844358 RepID=UPI001E61DD72|nr:GerAB/ArcD/ProY family transporter [Radiobacillus kanasensis]UFT99414.1 GerAB/ArcD/ProY family transporter [Radiobacillus kanasensis]
MWNSGFKWMFLIIGTMIGAGYASGRELWQFFGEESGLAILLFTILFTLSCYVILRISYEHKSSHYIPVLEKIVGKKLSVVYDGMILLYLFSTTVIMLAGSGATLHAFDLPNWFGIVVIAIPLVLVFVKDLNGVLSMNSFILPLLIVGLLSVLVIFSLQNQLSFFPDLAHQRNWTAAFPFTALNILPLIAVLGAIGDQVKGKGEIWIASLGSGAILGVISYIYNNSLVQISDAVLLYEIPLFAILKDYPYIMFLFMSAMLWLAIFTTAVSGTLGLVTRLRNLVAGPLWVLALITVVLMLPLTNIGFSTLIEYLYPLYGVLNLYVLSSIILYPIVNRYKGLEK